jgi:hypothetical protein
MKRFLFLAILALSLGGCGFPTDLFFVPPPVDTSSAGSPAPQPTPTFTIEPTGSPIPPTPVQCTYAWANKTLPDETALVQEALKKAGLTTVEVTVMAYGENCIDTLHNQVISFSEIETDFYFTVPVKDSRDQAEMGTWAEKIIPVMDGFPPGVVPGPNLGYCQFNFQDGTNDQTVWVKIELARRAQKNGLTAGVLYKALTAP